VAGNAFGHTLLGHAHPAYHAAFANFRGGIARLRARSAGESHWIDPGGDRATPVAAMIFRFQQSMNDE
jgi:hypothetical protein